MKNKFIPILFSSIFLLTACQFAPPELKESNLSESEIFTLADQISGQNANVLYFLSNDTVFRLDILRTLDFYYGKGAAAALAPHTAKEFFQFENDQLSAGGGRDSISVLVYNNPTDAAQALSSFTDWLNSPPKDLSMANSIDSEFPSAPASKAQANISGRSLIIKQSSQVTNQDLLSGKLSENPYFTNQNFHYSPNTLFSAFSAKKNGELSQAFWNYLQKAHPDFASKEHNPLLAQFESISSLTQEAEIEKLIITREGDTQLRFQLTLRLAQDSVSKATSQNIEEAKLALEDAQDLGKGRSVWLTHNQDFLQIVFIGEELLLSAN